MKKILVAIKNNSLIFTFNYKLEEEIKNIINTNIISDNKLVFSDEYIKKNYKLVGLFINDLVNNNKICRFVITNFEIISILKYTFDYIDNIDSLFISDETNFTYEAYEIISGTSIFKNINCYSIPTYMIDLFDKKEIHVESRQEILYTSNFMEENNLVSYSKIYYKSSIKISPPLTAHDISDFDSFCKVNRYLKTIHFDACSIDGIDSITSILIKNRIKKAKIIIHDNITNKEIIEELKKRKKEYNKYKLSLELHYTEEYVSNNYLKQLITTTLIFCAVIVLLIASGSTVYVILNNKESEKNIEEITNKIEEKIALDNLKNQEEQKNKQVDPDNGEEIDVPIPDFIPGTQVIPKMRSLAELNSETVGWLTVPGTNIDYPVVKGEDNEYYLNHNFDKKKDYNGWVFMNYVNNPKDLDQNTILFAHNRYYSGVMFGTLSNVSKPKWYNEAKNILIQYNTMYEEMQWEVFSIYKIKVTDDYLQTSFSSNNEWQEFIKMLKERSLFKSDVNITRSDKILTLSTCVENDRRLVVHAVLRK